MKIIEATTKDIPALIKLNNDAQEHHINLDPKKYKKTKKNELTSWFDKLLNDQSTKILIAAIDAMPTGYVIAKTIKREENEFKYSQRFILIDHINVIKSYRTKGYGRRLIEEIKKYAERLNIDTVSLFVLAKNSSAVEAYKKMGFEIEGIKMTLNLQDKEKDLWNGQQYKENSSPQEITSTAVIDSIKFNGNEYILDVGCGDGKLTKKLCPLIPNGKIIGIDPSANMIREAKKHKGGNISFLKQNAKDFSLDEKFDYAFSFHTLHWIADKTAVFKNIYNHLKQDGKFVFLTAGGNTNPNITNVFYSTKWQKLMPENYPKLYLVGKDKIKSMLLGLGFSIEELKAEQYSLFYSNKKDLINWMMGWVPFTTGLDEKNAIAFSSEIADNMVNESITNGITDKIEYKTEILTIKAFK